jgi:hypothetical protein
LAPNGEQQIKTATIKAVKMQAGVLQLLTAGEPLPKHENNSSQPKPLALTSAALEWVQLSPVSLQELYQQNPQVVKAFLASVWRSLQQCGDISVG